MEKSIKKAMLKLSAFAFKHKNLELNIELKCKFDSVWLSSEHVLNKPLDWVLDKSYYLNIVYYKDVTEKEFEQRIENEMAYLAVESRKLTKKAK